MSLPVLRTADGWWVAAEAGAVRVETSARTTGELLADRAAVAAAARRPDAVPVASLSLLSPVTTPCRVVAQLTNYTSHVRESGMNPATIPLTFFRKSSGSISGPQDDVVRPSHVQFLDYEAEIALVIGKRARRVREEHALEHVFGVTLAFDITARDLQKKDGQWTRAKGMDGFCPVGPIVVAGLDVGALALECRVNGVVKQRGEARNMIFSPATLIAYASEVMTLEPGDLILTGTPEGVGPLHAGDVIENAVESIGVLRATVAPPP